MASSLREFISQLEAAGELHRVRAQVSPILEVTEIADRGSKSPCPNESPHARAFDPEHCSLGGRALLFENVEGSDVPLLINAFGSYRRAEMALGSDFEAVAERIAFLTKPEPPASLADAFQKARRDRRSGS